MSVNYVFQLHNVQKSYWERTDEGGKKVSQRKSALKPTTLEIPANHCVAILGHSGAGKSTLMQLLGLLDDPDKEPDDAEIFYYNGCQTFSYLRSSDSGHVPLQRREEDKAWLRRSQFGFVFQQGHLLKHLTVADNVALAPTIEHGTSSNIRKHTKDLLESLGLGELAAKAARDLSGGERQRVAVLRALAQDPAVVFADEPTAHLDPECSKKVIQELVAWQRAGSPENPRTLLLVTHDAVLAFRVCDRFIVLHENEVVTRTALEKAVETTDALSESTAVFPTETSVLPQIIRSPQDLIPFMSRSQGGTRNAEDIETAFRGSGTTRDSSAAPSVDGEGCISNSQSSRRQPPTNRRQQTNPWHFCFLWRLAWKDLLRREDIGITSIVGLVLVLVTAICLVGYGLLEGTEQVMRRELESDEARELIVSGKPISDEILQKLATIRLRDSRPVIADPTHDLKRWTLASGYHFIKQVQSEKPAQAGRNTIPPPPGKAPVEDPKIQIAATVLANGYAVETDDPYLKNLKYLDGREFKGFRSEESLQIVVSRALLTNCGLDAKAEFIELRTEQAPVRFEIVGICLEMPGRVGTGIFAIPLGVDRSYRSGKTIADPDPFIHAAEIVGIDPAKGPAIAKLIREKIAADVSELDLNPKGSRLELRVKEGGTLSRSELERIARWTVKTLRREGFIAGNLAISSETVSTIPSQDATGTSFASLFVDKDKIQYMEQVADAVKAPDIGLTVYDPRVLLLLRHVRNTIGPLRLILRCLAESLIVISIVVTFINTWQRVRQKKAEFAILKACGMRRKQILAMYVLQGLALAIVVAAVSAGSSQLAGRGMALRIADSDRPELQQNAEGQPSGCAADGKSLAENDSNLPQGEDDDFRLLRHVFGRLDHADPLAEALYRFNGIHVAIACAALPLLFVLASVGAAAWEASKAPAEAVR